MILCQGLGKSDINRIGEEVAEAFLAEHGAFCNMTKKEASKLFRIIVGECYRSGHLYTTSDNEEGFIVYWTKRERPGKLAKARMLLKMSLGLKPCVAKCLKKSATNWISTEERYKDKDNFVEVFLICVRREYQGQGYFRMMLEEAFNLASKEDTICVLDTDSDLKAAKYSHVGMKVVEKKLQRSGLCRYALEYNMKRG